MTAATSPDRLAVRARAFRQRPGRSGPGAPGTARRAGAGPGILPV